MEADRQIIRQFGMAVEGCTIDSIKFIARNIALTGFLGYAGFQITKKIYVSYTVNSASVVLKKELEDGQSKIQDSIARWKSSGEYSNLLKISGGVAVEDYITSMNFDELVISLRNGSISAYSALKSFQIKAMESTAKCNNVVAWISEADHMAMALDKVPVEERKAFHGVPISIKECFAVKNTHNNAGMIYFNKKKSQHNAPAVQTCINLGAVPFCKTNIPQAMYSMQCDNPLYGTTGNPHNPSREAGGSSGGEGSLIGGRGSILGLGSDIGGSLRSPAACCGIYSMKPTIGRHLSNLDATPTAGPDPARMEAIAGFMAATPDILEYCWRTYYNLEGQDDATRFDPLIAPVRFNEEQLNKKVKVGFFYSEGLYQPLPAVKRAVQEAVQTLTAAGYESVEFAPPNIEKVLTLFNGIVCADMSHFNKYIKWDKHSSSLQGLQINNFVMNLPRIMRRFLINPLLRCLTNIPPLEKYLTTTSELFQGLDDKHELSMKYFQSMENEGVDVIICPGQIVPALPTGCAGMFVPILFPYLMWNVLNMPAGVAPITKYNANDNKLMEDYPWNDLTYRMMHQYTKGAEGLPLTVQVVAKPFHEEQVLQVMKVLHNNGTYRV